MSDKKLSDMIFLGAKKSPAVERGWYGVNEEGKMTTCAIMAAAEECGLVAQDGGGHPIFSPELERVTGGTDRLTGAYRPWMTRIKWPDWFYSLLHVRATSPCGCPDAPKGKRSGVVGEIVMHLHDDHKYSREATAMWVESVEKDYERGVTTLCPGWGGRAPVAKEVPNSVLV